LLDKLSNGDYIVSNTARNFNGEGMKMKKTEIRIGMEITYSNRKAVVEKIKGDKVKVRPSGESSRWIKISDISE